VETSATSGYELRILNDMQLELPQGAFKMRASLFAMQSLSLLIAV
jgi:hypothetical protein